MRPALPWQILGPVGDFKIELYAYQLHFNILPCRYPSIDSWGLLPFIDAETLDAGREVCTHLQVFSIDNASTRDIDDALSFEFSGPGDMATCRIGIHVADVAALVPTNSPLFEWARARATSAYHQGPSDDGVGGGSVPMLPPQLAHGALSLNEGQVRPALTLWLYVEMASLSSFPALCISLPCNVFHPLLFASATFIRKNTVILRTHTLTHARARAPAHTHITTHAHAHRDV